MRVTDADSTQRIEAVYADHRKRLLASFKRRGWAWDLAEDALQDAFLRLFQMAEDSPSRPEEGKEPAWLWKVVARRLQTLGRKDRKRAARATEYASGRPAAAGTTPLDEALKRDEEQRVRALLPLAEAILEERGTARMRLTLGLWLEGRTVRQIAAEVGVSRETAQLDLRTVWKLLRVELTRRGWSIH